MIGLYVSLGQQESAPADEVDDFHRIAVFQGHFVIIPARYDGAVQFDGNAVCTIFLIGQVSEQVLAGIEFILKGKNFRPIDLLQIPLSIILTRFFNLFGALIPDVTSLPARILCLVLGIAFTGIGAAMNVDTRLIPNPGDGIVQALADRLQKKMGNVKNVFDFGCVTATLLIGLLSAGHPVGVGVGTIAAMIGVGRFIWIYNRLFQAKQQQLTGVAY